ncbi:acyl-CoA dehydrogenase [Paenibacillus sp. J5C_2022]|uniref:acyl-CoA dehydrogenase n=1 Tax=Paenibacillus sp. J5C2022 TaxID=2977129 RepID=UPI0021D1E152|nr:acyl-CoA dehydrogenase [Paenibacillus sp. J5C2022]MCU6708822.1 acyl-CoA dehydrogenase [Paenibacillus sp. J5C2022]
MALEQRTIDHIRSLSLQSEHEGKLSSEALQCIMERGWFKLFVPKAFGGAMSPLPDALRLYQYASWVDGSFGWLTTIGAGGGYFAAFMQQETAEQVFASQEAVIAGSGAPTGTAVHTEGGYIVNGKWSFCSGSEYATTFTANCIIDNGDNSDSANPDIRAFAFFPHQVEIVRDWRAFGLKTTGSHTIVVRNQFVPETRTFSFLEQQAYHDEPLFSYPFLPFAQATFCAIGIGIASHLLDEARSLAHKKQEAWQESKAGRYEYVMRLIGQAEDRLNSEAAAFYDTIERSWSDHVQGQPFTDEEIAEVGQCCKRTARAALACGERLIPKMGISAVMENEPLNQTWRDLQVACQHSVLVSFEEE